MKKKIIILVLITVIVAVSLFFAAPKMKEKAIENKYNKMTYDVQLKFPKVEKEEKVNSYSLNFYPEQHFLLANLSKKEKYEIKYFYAPSAVPPAYSVLEINVTKLSDNEIENIKKDYSDEIKENQRIKAFVDKKINAYYSIEIKYE